MSQSQRRKISSAGGGGSAPLGAFDDSLRNLQQRLGSATSSSTTSTSAAATAAAAHAKGSTSATSKLKPSPPNPSQQQNNKPGPSSVSTSGISAEGAALLSRISNFDLFETVKQRHGEAAFPNAAASASQLGKNSGKREGAFLTEDQEKEEEEDGAGAEVARTMPAVSAVDSGAGGGRINSLLHQQKKHPGVTDNTVKGAAVTSSIGEDEPLPDSIRAEAIAAASEIIREEQDKKRRVQQQQQQQHKAAPASAKKQQDVSLANFSVQLASTAESLDRFMYFDRLFSELASAAGGRSAILK